MKIFSFFKKNSGGRNNSGHITVRHRGALLKRKKFFRFFNYVGIIRGQRRRCRFLRIPKSNWGYPVCYKRSAFSYCVSAFSPRFSFKSSSFRANQYFEEFTVTGLYMIPIGSYIYNVQNYLGDKGPLFSRAPGSYTQLLKRRGSFATVRLASGEIRRINARCYAISAKNMYQVSTPTYYKAGQSRKLGIRPHVRGCAINPVDHPHGGRTGESRPSVSPWAQLTKGFRTRTKAIHSKVVLTSVQFLKSNKLYK